MGKLWSKGYDLNTIVEEFTVGSDYILDARLVPADLLGSLAHAMMLASAGLITEIQRDDLCRGLRAILAEHEQDEFTIRRSDEDVHTAIENRLADLAGETGRRIHLGRSRNDQVLTAMRIWMRHCLFRVVEAGCGTVSDLLDFARAGEKVPMPGRTHMQPAMPSTVGLWAGGFAEQLLDDLEGIAGLYDFFDQCPLGSGAGYGVPLPLNRELTASLLGFSRVQSNVTYGGLCRGKFESRFLDSLEQAAITLSKLAADLILFSLPEFGWFTLPAELCTGSSIMPQKRNPDGLELMRAKAASVGAWSGQVKNIIRSLPSGYNRDFQETKGPTFQGADTVLAMLEMAGLTIRELKINKNRLLASFDPAIFATDAAIDLAVKGASFRDAYREIGTNLQSAPRRDPMDAIADRTSTGSAGNPRFDIPEKALSSLNAKNAGRIKTVDAALEELAGRPVRVI